MGKSRGLLSISMAKGLEIWPVDRLLPYARNARTHSAEQIEKIAASILEFGFNNPILVDAQRGIVAGHGRLEAAKSLGMGQVPVIELTHLTEEQKRAYVIADNRLAEDAGWDADLLKAELTELEALDFDLALTGFTDVEIERILAGVEDGEAQDLSVKIDPRQRLSLKVTDEQHEQILAAMYRIRKLDPSANPDNDDDNANALARICEVFLTQNGRRQSA